MKTIQGIAVAAALITGATVALADDSKIYAGIGAGQTKVRDIGSKDDVLGTLQDAAEQGGITDFDGTASASIKDTGTGFKLFAGYQFNANFALEAAYTNLGQVKAKAKAMGDFYCEGYCFTGTLAIQEKVKSSALSIDALGKYDVTPWVGLYARLGVYQATTKDKIAVTVSDSEEAIALSDSSSTKSTGLHYGVGAEFTLTHAIALRTEFERFNKVKSDSGKSDVDLLSASLIYKF